MAIDSPTSLDLAKAIANFEHEFSYPLGENTRFRISHGDNYSGLYSSIGESQSFLAESNGIIYGAISTALRTLYTPEGETLKAAYVGDFKVSKQADSNSTAYRLLKEAQQWILARTDYAFCIVMNGTSRSPVDYTGRLGIEKLRLLGEVSILRINTKDKLLKEPPLLIADENEPFSLYKSLVSGRWSMQTAMPTTRSKMETRWLVHNNRLACGLMEDTRKVKRLFTLDNQEILTAHLSHFAYSTPVSGAEIIMMSLNYAAEHGYPSIFVAVDPEHVSVFRELLSPAEILEARASIFENLSSDFLKTAKWSVNTSEI